MGVLNEGIFRYIRAMSESKLWLRTKRGFPGLIERIEVRMPLGFPDTVFRTGGLMGYVELKFEEKYVRAEQAIFLRRWSNEGAAAMVLAELKGEHFLMHGSDIPLNRTIPYNHAVWVGNEINGTILARELLRANG